MTVWFILATLRHSSLFYLLTIFFHFFDEMQLIDEMFEIIDKTHIAEIYKFELSYPIFLTL